MVDPWPGDAQGTLLFIRGMHTGASGKERGVVSGPSRIWSHAPTSRAFDPLSWTLLQVWDPGRAEAAKPLPAPAVDIRRSRSMRHGTRQARDCDTLDLLRSYHEAIVPRGTCDFARRCAKELVVWQQ